MVKADEKQERPDTEAGEVGDNGGDGVGRAVTPSDRVPVPEPGPDGVHDLEQPEYYLNRELTWLNFNFRVLHEAEDPRTPLLERVKFLAIVSSNLDEFVMKRRTPQEQVEEAYELIRRLERRKLRCLGVLAKELEKAGIVLTTYDRLEADQQEYLRAFYLRNIFPLVTPQATDPAQPYPFI